MKVFVCLFLALIVGESSVTNVYCSGSCCPTKCSQYVFSVQHGGSLTAGSGHTKIPFNVIKRNDDGVYNTGSSEFSAPIKGVYSFHYSAASRNGYMAVYLRSSIQGWLVSAVATTTNGQASNMVNIELVAGENIYVQLNPGHSSRSCIPPCSTFSGQLLYEIS